MDGRFIDMINPMDVRESVQLEASDFEYRRIPTWMANATYFWGANSLQFLYIPNFEQERLPIVGSPWFPPSVPPLSTAVAQPTQATERRATLVTTSTAPVWTLAMDPPDLGAAFISTPGMTIPISFSLVSAMTNQS